MRYKCHKCDVSKDISEFVADKRRSFGKSSKCKSCLREYARVYRAANLEKRRESDRRSSKKNQDRRNATSRARKAQMKIKVDPMEQSMIRALYWISRVLSRSCGEEFHVDHIMPLAKGGLHIFENMQVLSAEENLKKGVG